MERKGKQRKRWKDGEQKIKEKLQTKGGDGSGGGKRKQRAEENLKSSENFTLKKYRSLSRSILRNKYRKTNSNLKKETRQKCKKKRINIEDVIPLQASRWQEHTQQ